MTDATARLALPLIQPGQAQKEVFHNEALVLLDAAVNAAVQEAGRDVPPDTPAEGEGWIVGAAPTGAWAGHARALAVWTAGGWRFVAAHEGMAAWHVDGQVVLRFAEGAWRQPSPVGGATIDVEARATLAALMSVLREQGMLGV